MTQRLHFELEKRVDSNICVRWLTPVKKNPLRDDCIKLVSDFDLCVCQLENDEK